MSKGRGIDAGRFAIGCNVEMQYYFQAPGEIAHSRSIEVWLGSNKARVTFNRRSHDIRGRVRHPKDGRSVA